MMKYELISCYSNFLENFPFRSEMKAILLRTGSASIQASLVYGSPKGYPSDEDLGTGISFSGKNSPRSTLHFDMKSKKQIPKSIRRSVSDTDLIRSEIGNSSNRISIHYSPAKIAEDEGIDLQREADEDKGSLILKRNGFELCNLDRVSEIFPENEVLVEELEFSGGGMGKGRKAGGGGNESGDFSGGNADQNKIGAYYQQMLQANPGNSLLLRNYGKFLHEVEKDYGRAEEYYGRAILASPGDGDVLSLYGKLIWEMRRDKERAEGYFDQAIKACPDDCYVLGSYAHFLWDADADEDEEEEEEEEGKKVATESPALVEAR